ncbi:MAG: GntR family transcriptional regulator [Deltaproteobacteria bacterium]|nr:GntR family transcriptional regulator [Deltaproteobacteria bacterium]
MTETEGKTVGVSGCEGKTRSSVAMVLKPDQRENNRETEMMHRIEDSNVPLYRQVEDFLRTQMARGHLKEGDLIPSEIALAREYGVSQGTVRKAILNLTQKGILYRKQGKGTFVVFPKQNLKRFRNFRFVEDLNSELAHVDLVFRSIEVLPADARIAKNLGLRKGTKVFCLERLGRIGGTHLLHTRSYLPKRLYKGLEQFGAEDFFKNTLWKLQDIYFGIRVEKREEYISAIAAGERMAKTLEVEPGSPILRIEVKLTSFAGDIVEYRCSHCQHGDFRFYVGQRGEG